MVVSSPASGPTWTERGLMGAGPLVHLWMAQRGGNSAVLYYQESLPVTGRDKTAQVPPASWWS